MGRISIKEIFLAGKESNIFLNKIFFVKTKKFKGGVRGLVWRVHGRPDVEGEVGGEQSERQQP